MQRFYGNVLLIVVLPAVLLVNFYAWSGLQAFSTGLTRVGGYQEEDYGWSGTEFRFAEPPAELIEDGGVYEKYTDMVVFGDSFSLRKDSSWVYHFVNATGLSAQAMYYYQGGIERLVDTDLYKTHPPRVVVFEVVERLLEETFSNSPVDCKESDASVPLPADFRPLNIPLIGYQRDTSGRYGDYKLAVKILGNKLSLLTGNTKRLKAIAVPLTLDSLFSNRKSSRLLYFRDDHRKKEWSKQVPMKVRCGLNGIKEQVEANGYTAFAVMLVADKLSVYSPWLADDGLAHLTVLDDDILTGIPHSIDIRGKAIREIERGFVDFYLPGDTHWSSRGDKLVAQWMVELFQADSASPH